MIEKSFELTKGINFKVFRDLDGTLWFEGDPLKKLFLVNLPLKQSLYKVIAGKTYLPPQDWLEILRGQKNRGSPLAKRILDIWQYVNLPKLGAEMEGLGDSFHEGTMR